MENRESLEIGKASSPMRHKHENLLNDPSIPKYLNDINKHKETYNKSCGYNVLTGSYNRVGRAAL